jgi:hypothetical protein
MFKPVKVLLSLTFVGLLLSCQPVDSLNPLYTEKDTVFDPALLGKWREKDSTLEFFQSGTNEYQVIFTDDSTPPEQMELSGHLVSLEGHRFLDLVQKRWSSPPNSYELRIDKIKNNLTLTPALVPAGDGAYIEFAPTGSDRAKQVKMQMRVAHWFFRFSVDGKTLEMDYIDDDRLNKALAAKAVQIAHLLIPPEKKNGQEEKPQLVLTAITAELQKFVLDHVNDDQMFAGAMKYERAEK